MKKTAICVGVFDDSHIWLKEAKDLGYEIVATHPKPLEEKFYYEQVKPYIDHTYLVEHNEDQKLIEIAEKHNVSMTIPHPATNDANLAQCMLNSVFNLRGIRHGSAKLCLDKWEFHKFLESYNLPRPKWCEIYNPNRVLDYDYPLIMKPSLGGGSQGIRKVYSPTELLETMERSKKDFGEFPMKKYDKYIIQDYVRAKYTSGLNCGVKNGELIIFTHYARDNYGLIEQLRQPFFYYEDGIYARDNNFITPESYKELQRCITALGIVNGAVRFDVFLDEDLNLVNIVEINLRPGSSHSATGFHDFLGKNTSHELVKLSTDQSDSVDFSWDEYETPYRYMYVKNMRFKGGKIRSVQFPEFSKNVHHFSHALAPGVTIPDYWDVNVAHMCGQLILHGETYESMILELDSIMRGIRLEYE